MAHKFVPRKGFKKDKDQPAPEQPAAETPGPPEVPTEEVTAPEPPAMDEEAADIELTPRKPVPRGETRSAKDSILKKLPGKAGPKSLPRLEGRRKPDRGRPASRGISLPMLILVSVATFLLVGGGVAVFFLSQVPGYHSGVAVTAPTRLDWTFVEGPQSLEKPDPTMLASYDSTKGRFDLYVPPSYDASQPQAMILFLSSDSRPAGWSAFKKVCIENHVIFASPAGAGDDVPIWQRTRIALDVLDEVRRKYKVDPDKTYIGGYWGGAREACRIAFALPELFAGVIAVGGGDLMREEAWLRHRARERLSLAWVTNDKDPAHIEVRELHHPLFKDLNIRSEPWNIEGQSGRAMPPPDMAAAIFKWLDDPDALKKRRDIAARYPESRGPEDPANRSECAKAYFFEGKKRVENRDDGVSGAAQLSVCQDRWKGVPAADEARRLRKDALEKEPAWLEAELKEQRDYDLKLARKLTAFLSDHAHIDQYELAKYGWVNERQRDWDKQVRNLWQRISQLGSTDADKKEAEKNLAAIAKGLFSPPPPPTTARK